MIKNIMTKIKEIIKKMLDKKGKDAYIWYSGATDVTGIKLANALGIAHGKDRPDFSKYNLIIGWGAKIDESLSINTKTINHPNQILANRDKLEALSLMRKANVRIADFIESSSVVNAVDNHRKGITTEKGQRSVFLPLIGRTKSHQGGKGFWICPTMTHVKAAIDDGAKYFQNMIEIKDEYRLHIFNDKLIYSVRKSKRSKEEYQDAYIHHELEHQKNLAKKNGNPFDEPTAKLMLERMAKKKVADGADMIIRSNRLGWKFSHVKSVNEYLKDEAIKALKALGLDFGAVDCCIDVNDVPYIIEVNTGPGLEESSFNTYVKMFRSILDNPAKNVTSAKEKNKQNKHFFNTKDELLAKSALITEIIQNADESEADALKSVFKKMFD